MGFRQGISRGTRRPDGAQWTTTAKPAQTRNPFQSSSFAAIGCQPTAPASAATHISRRPIQSPEYKLAGLLLPCLLASCSLNSERSASLRGPPNLPAPSVISSSTQPSRIKSSPQTSPSVSSHSTSIVPCLPIWPCSLFLCVRRSADSPPTARSHRALLRLASHHSFLLRPLPAF